MTIQLYLKDSYQKEFTAEVTAVNDKFIVLTQTLFYPQGGGQPTDTGKLICNENEYKVVFAKKIGNDISHEINQVGLKVGDKITGILDWERRYRLMRMHTAAHIVSGVFHKKAGALITGNQLELDKTRVDFDLENFDREKLNEYIQKANEIVEENHQIKIYSVPRAEAEQMEGIAKLAIGLPPSIQEIRIVEIEGFDKQADGGTHVNSTKEVGKVTLLKAENKGKSNRRVYFNLG